MPACRVLALELASGQWGLLRPHAHPHQRSSHLFYSPALQLISLSLAGSGSFGDWVVSSRLLSFLPRVSVCLSS